MWKKARARRPIQRCTLRIHKYTISLCLWPTQHVTRARVKLSPYFLFFFFSRSMKYHFSRGRANRCSTLETVKYIPVFSYLTCLPRQPFWNERMYATRLVGETGPPQGTASRHPRANVRGAPTRVIRFPSRSRSRKIRHAYSQ
ncbi:hypothetical protein PUN28_017320 [Cardiocondyla obscurior]|uniref:Uncharacterized protein n=1 Tax=Cardiocondyla obscurior TaxID=286306 RepID=A0AAW2EML9_9HYME